VIKNIYILIRDVQKWVDQKMLKNSMKKNVLYNISKDQNSKSGSPKNEGVKKT
jgi:hypothetical protein